MIEIYGAMWTCITQFVQVDRTADYMQIKHFFHKIHDFIIGFVSNVLITHQYSKNL